MVDEAAKRVVAAIVGGVFGLAGGILFALFVVGFGAWFVPAVALVTLAGIVTAVIYPAPFLFVGSLVLDIFASG